MTAFVVDTNVAMAANGRGTHADLPCQLRCVERLEFLRKHGVFAIDHDGVIFSEYRKNLRHSGGPGVGDKFFKYVFDNQGRNDRVQRMPITNSADDRRGFNELPENELDPSDRKFLAVAVVANAVILNATDSDWAEQKALVDTLGVKVEQLCLHHAVKAARGRR